MENGLSFLNSYGYVMYWCKKKLIAGASQGVMPFRPVNEAAVKDWQSLGAIFERILGGSETSQEQQQHTCATGPTTPCLMMKVCCR